MYVLFLQSLIDINYTIIFEKVNFIIFDHQGIK